MIAYLTGKIIAIDIATLIIKTESGVGYEVEIASQKQFNFDETIALFIHHHVREDAQRLYGFDDSKARDLFRILIKTSGVGPKSALTILTHKTPDTIAQAVIGKQPGLLTGIKGVGSKIIDKIIIECQQALKNWSPSRINNDTKDTNSIETDAVVALEQLGYRNQPAKQAVKKLLDQKPYDNNIQQLIVDALKEI